MDHYVEVGTADSVAEFRSSPTRPLERCSGYHRRSDSADRWVVFSICLLWVYVRMYVCQHYNSWTVWDIIMKFYGSKIWSIVKSSEAFESGCIPNYCGMRVVSDVLLSNNKCVKILSTRHPVQHGVRPQVLST